MDGAGSIGIMKVAAIVLFLTTSLTFAQQRPQFENWDKDK
ncbi:MAG: hypothetical protein ACI9MB_000539, partial [Verrucomicrobiales bacterium]